MNLKKYGTRLWSALVVSGLLGDPAVDGIDAEARLAALDAHLPGTAVPHPSKATRTGPDPGRRPAGSHLPAAHSFYPCHHRRGRDGTRMSRRQKGRKHREVNRTPRPGGRAPLRLPGSSPRKRRRSPAAQAVEAVGPVGAATEAARVPAPAAGPPEDTGPAPVLTVPVSGGGLGLPAARTWQGLRGSGPAGASVAELCATAGFTAPTVVRHLRALAGFGLARRSESGQVWHPTDADPAAIALVPAPARSGAGTGAR